MHVTLAPRDDMSPFLDNLKKLLLTNHTPLENSTGKTAVYSLFEFYGNLSSIHDALEKDLADESEPAMNGLRRVRPEHAVQQLSGGDYVEFSAVLNPESDNAGARCGVSLGIHPVVGTRIALVMYTIKYNT